MDMDPPSEDLKKYYLDTAIAELNGAREALELDPLQGAELEEVVEQIDWDCSSYVEYAEAAAKGERPASIRRDLERIEKSCRRLVNALEQAGDQSLHQLRLPKWPAWKGSSLGYLAHLRAKGDDLPVYQHEDYDVDPRGLHDQPPPSHEDWNLWVPKLRSLEILTQEVLASLTENVGEDRGGQNVVSRRHEGHEKWQLTRNCWSMFEYRAGTPTSTETGSFMRFLRAVYGVATGQDGEGAGLERFAKDAAFICGEAKRNREEVWACEAALDSLQKMGESSEKTKTRLALLWQRWDIIHQALANGDRKLLTWVYTSDNTGNATSKKKPRSRP